jgi:TonB family protein
MTPSLDLLRSLGAWSVEGFWMPLFAWTVLASLVWILLRAWRAAPPLVSYAALTSVLLALPLGVLFANITNLSLIALWTPTPSSLTLPALPSALAPTLMPETTAPVFAWTFLHSLGLVMVIAGLMALGALVRLGTHSLSLARLRRTLQRESQTPDTKQTLAQYIEALGLRMPVQLVVTSKEIVPLTFGWRRPIIVIPASLLEDDEALRLTLLHELVHIRRADYLSQWIGYAVGAIFAIHPLVWLLRRSIGGYREMACDAAVLDQRSISGKRYAALLYRFALNHSANPQLALSMAAAHRELKKRILAMKSYKTRPSRFAPSTVALTLAVLLLGLTTLIVACTDLVGPDPAAEATADKKAGTFEFKEAFAVVEEMPGLIGGLEAIQQDLRYPKLAKLAGIEGRVFIQFVVGTDGKVSDAKVVRGVGSGLDEEALRVVQAATFTPGRQGGETVPVKMSLPVTFRLNEEPFSESKLTIQNNLPLNIQKLTGHQIRDIQVTANGETLQEGPDYLINSETGTITITNEKYLEEDLILSIRTTNKQ